MLRLMQDISNEAEFARLLKASHAIVFIDFAWSGQARLSAAVITEWERTSNLWGLNCPLSRVRPEDVPAVASWLAAQAERLTGEGGYGSLIWLRNGAIVDYEPNVAGAGLRDISQRTRIAFSKEETSGSAASELWDRELDG
jgi:hypothetical protein